jgi:GTPase
MSIVAVVGRPNVGKSTLFNRILRKNLALVADQPGVTRDRNYAQVDYEGKTFTLVDTGGYVSADSSEFEQLTREQILLALDEADILLFVADAKTGLHPEDPTLVNMLRRTAKPVFFAANKIDGPEQTPKLADFYELGLDPVYPVSGSHGFGVDDLLTDIAAAIPAAPEEADTEGTIRVAIVGRPNVGKSTLVNYLLGAPRAIVSPLPGTTRDALDSLLQARGKSFLLIDTAGIRRKGKTRAHIEKISVIKALHSIDRCHVAVVLIDPLEGVTDQDLHIAGYVQDRYKGCLVGVNKWDALELQRSRSKQFLAEVRERFRFMPHAPLLTFSATTGQRVPKLLPAISEVYGQYNQRITTGILNRALEQTLQRHEPPVVKGRRLKFYYATQASTRPPTFVLFCNYPEAVHFSYERYLINQFREDFGLTRTPIKLVFRGRGRGDKLEPSH